MSLNFSYKNCQEDVNAPNEWNITETLIFNTMVIGISDITEENFEEVMFRTRLRERLYGNFLYDDDAKSLPITRAQVAARIGLTTNTSDETRAQFIKRHIDNIGKEITYALFRERETSDLNETFAIIDEANSTAAQA